MTAVRKFKLASKAQAHITLLGLLTDEKDYKFSWHLNSLLNIHLKKAPDFRWMNNKLPQLQHFPCFADSEQHDQSIRLILNSSHEHIRISPFRQFDYLLLIPPDYNPDPKKIKDALRDSDIVRGVYDLDVSAILEWLD